MADRMEAPESRQAGRELDAEVAEKVIGWTVERDWPSERVGGEWFAYEPSRGEVYSFHRRENYERTEHWYRHPDNRDYLVLVPSFSTSIADAWLVVEKMRERGIYIDLRASSSGYFAMWSRAGRDDEDIWVTGSSHMADDAPLAICLAALKALGNVQSDTPPTEGQPR